MATFMQEARGEGRAGILRTVLEKLRLHVRGLSCSRGPSPGLQFISPKMRYSITARDKLAKEHNVYSAKTVVDNLIKREGDATML